MGRTTLKTAKRLVLLARNNPINFDSLLERGRKPVVEASMPGEDQMPLERLSDRSYICEPHGVRFGMRKGEQTVLCILTREALVKVFGSSDQCQWENLFQANRTIVEAIASEIYDAGEHRTPIHVTSRDLDPNFLITSAVVRAPPPATPPRRQVPR
jgi:hypothetical protein